MSTLVLITPKNESRLFEILTELSYAMGVVNRYELEREQFLIPARFAPYLDDMGERIEHLTNEEIAIFCDGEETEAQEIAERSFGLTKAYELLNAMFDGEGSL